MPDCSHYMLNFDVYDSSQGQPQIKDKKARELYGIIKEQFSTLAWCRKWLEPFYERHFQPLNHLVQNHIVNPYPPLSDVFGCYTAQFEHTILLRPTCKEILTRGDDY